MSVHQPDASEDEPVGRNSLLGQGEPAGGNNGTPNDSSVVLPILEAIFKEILFGSYKSATYINAASFLREAVINETAKAEVNANGNGSGLTRYVWARFKKYSAKATNRALRRSYEPPQSSSSSLSTKEWLQALATVCATEAIIQGLETPVIQRCGAWIMILIRLVVRTIQMAALGYIGSPSRKGILIGSAMGALIACIRETITYYFEKSNMDQNIKKELVTEQQTLLWIYSQAAFLPYARNRLGIPYTVDNTGPIAMAPLAVMTLMMMLITDYKRMREQRAAYVAQGAARIWLLGAVTGCGIGWKPRMSLIAGSQGIAMWVVLSTMAYIYDW